MFAVYFHLGVGFTALLIALVIQWLRPERRTANIFITAIIPPALLLLTSAAAFATAETPSDWSRLSLFQITLNFVFGISTLTVVGLFGAVIGTELASLWKWMRHHRGR